MKSIQELEEVLDSAATSLPKLSSRKMFGCHALWAGTNVFALVWKHGRIGVKLPDEKVFASLMDEPGSQPWKAGPMTMAHWVLVPEKFHADSTRLRQWVSKAHGLCVGLKKVSAKRKKTPVRKKSAAVKTKKR